MHRQTNEEVEIEHWLLKLLEPADSDLTRLLKHFDANTGRLQRELTAAVEKMKRGHRGAFLAADVIHWMQAAWVLASLKYRTNAIRSGYLLQALLTDEKLKHWLGGAVPELARIPADRLERDLGAVIEASPESQFEATAAAAAPSGAPGPAAGSKTPSLDQFTINLTERANKGEIDPVIGRDFEIRQVIDILTRRRQNNPILTGEAGVGKTAVVEGFALRVVAGDVPRAAEERRGADARPGPVAGRRRRQGRVRESAQVGHRRGQGVAAADHPVHRRGPHDDRRRRGRPARATPPICSSRPWPAASCAPSRPPPGWSTRSISRTTPP